MRAFHLVCVFAVAACGDDGNVNPLPDAPPPNVPPEVTITARNLQALVGQVVTLRASATDANGDPLTLAWTQTAGPAVTLLDPASATPSYIARAVGVYEFSVVANDGDRMSPPVEIRVDVYDIDGGEDHTLALKPDGTLLSWGDNSSGQLGDPSVDGNRRFVGPVCEPGLPGCVPFSGVVAIATGRAHSLALKADGTVWAWGDHTSGQLGVGFQKINGSAEPLQVCNVGATDCAADPLTDVVHIAAGFVFSVALKKDGTVVAWGSNNFGELGNGSFNFEFSPVRVCAPGSTVPTPAGPAFGVASCTEFLDNVVQLTAGGGGHTIAIRGDGTVVAWGHNKSGQVGMGDSDQRNVPVPTPVCAEGQVAPCTEFLTDVVAVDAWSGHSLALKSDGTFLAWGSNDESELGAVTTEICNSNSNCSEVPVKVCLSNDDPCSVPFANVRSFAAGRRFSIALTTDGKVFAWGDNVFGQLGNGEQLVKVPNPVPSPVCAFGAIAPCGEFLEGVGAVAAGSFHAMALRDNGLLFTWGDNDFGQLGNDDLANGPIPVVVGGF